MAKNSRRSISGPLLKDTLSDGESALLQNGIASASLEAQLLLSYVLGMKRHELFLSGAKVILREKREQFLLLIDRRCSGVPSQYLLKSCEFMGYDFEVGPGVLIPRPETEILVGEVVTEQKKASRDGESGAMILDIGTGSGAIAISLAMILSGVKVVAVEISPEALLFAERNIAKHFLTPERVELRSGDLFEPVRDYAGRVWAIVSNPPYVKTSELETLPVEVRDHEPREALDGGPDGLSVTRKIVEGSAEFLAPGGILALEIHEDSADKVVAMIKNTGKFADERIVRDLAGKERIVIGVRSSNFT